MLMMHPALLQALVERSKEARSPTIKLDLLTRALDKLTSQAPPANPPASATQPAPGPARTAQHNAARRRTWLWGELIKSAASGGMDAVVRAAAPHALAVPWPVDVDREMAMLQARMSLQEADACLAGIKAAKAEPCPLDPNASASEATETETTPAAGTGTAAKGAVHGGDGDVAVVRMPATTATAMCAQLPRSVLRAMMTGVSVKEPWLVINAGIAAFNAYLPLMAK